MVGFSLLKGSERRLWIYTSSNNNDKRPKSSRLLEKGQLGHFEQCDQAVSGILLKFFINFFLCLALKYGLKGGYVPAPISKMKKVIKGLMFTDQGDPAQNAMAIAVIRSMYAVDFGQLHTQNFHLYLDYVLDTWFSTDSVIFLGKNANFHREILSEVTPQLTNNCSESLNSALKNIQKAGYIPMSKVVNGKFYHFF